MIKTKEKTLNKTLKKKKREKRSYWFDGEQIKETTKHRYLSHPQSPLGNSLEPDTSSLAHPHHHLLPPPLLCLYPSLSQSHKRS